MFCFSFSCVDLLHGNCLLIRFNFSIKILLDKMNFLFWILLCYLLNMPSSCIVSISWCCFVVSLFRCSSHVSLFHSIPIVSPVFRCFARVTVLRQCSGVPPVFCRCSVFRCSWFYLYVEKKTISRSWPSDHVSWMWPGWRTQLVRNKHCVGLPWVCFLLIGQEVFTIRPSQKRV